MPTPTLRRQALRQAGLYGSDHQLDAAIYGDHVDWSYLFDAEALFERRGVISGRMVA